MPICKNCHSRITKFDKDICPICGEKNPLDGVTSDTIEITHGIDASNPEFKDSLSRRKGKTLLLFALIGWTGAPYIYLRYKVSRMIIWLLINLVIIGGIGSLLCFLTPLKFFGFLIGLAAAYIVNIIIGLYYKFAPDRRDGQGELIL